MSTFITYYTASVINDKTLLSVISEMYQNDIVKHIGYTKDSYVYYLSNTNKVIKCFEKNKDEIDYEYELNIKLINFNKNKKLSLAAPEEIFYIQTINLNKIYCCLVLPYFKYDLETYENTDKLKKCTLETKRLLINQLMEGIDQLHELGFYHGDLKLKNICIDIESSKNKSELKIIDFGCSSFYSLYESRFILKNTTTYATPIQLVNHLISFNKNCTCFNTNILCSYCVCELSYKNKLMKILIDKYNVKIIKKSNTTINSINNLNKEEKYEELIEEDCKLNDKFGAALVMYFILTGQNFFNNSTVLSLIEETLIFLNDPHKFINEKIIKINDDLDEEYLDYFKSILLDYLKNINKDTIE
jgi:serine/threonine protein kinase